MSVQTKLICVWGLPRALVLMAFFNVARGNNAAFMTIAHAQILLNLLPPGERIGSWDGIPLGLRFGRWGMLETTYDAYHGHGFSRRVVRSLRFHLAREKLLTWLKGLVRRWRS